MESIKISQLPEMTSPTDNDVLAGVDISENETNKIQLSTLKTYTNGQQDTKIQQLESKTQEHDTKITTLTEKTDELTTKTETNTTDIKNLSNRTKRIETDIFDSGEASGTGINLQDSTLAEFQEVKIDGVGNQETTNGNQILDFANPTRSSTGLTSVFENDTLEIVGHSGTIYQSVYYNIPLDFLENNKGKTIKFSKKSSKTTNSSADSVVQIISSYNDETPTTYRRMYDFSKDIPLNDYIIPQDLSNLKSVIASFYTNNSSSTEIENNLTIEEPLLYFDNNDTYEPYTGREPSPSPDYPQPIEVIEDDFDLVSCGTQLIDFSTFKTNYGVTYTFENDVLTIIGDGSTAFQSIYKTITYLVKSNAGKTLYFDFETLEKKQSSGTIVQLNINYNDGTSTTNRNMVSSNEAKSSYTIPSDTSNISSASLNIYTTNLPTAVANTVKITKPMLQFGTEKKDYEPYTETRQTITIPEGEFAGKIDDTYKDQFRINYNEEDGKYHLYLDKKIGKVVFDGDENWAFRDDVIVEGLKCYRNQGLDYSIIGSITNALSNYFRYSYTNELNSIRFIQSQGYAMQICIDENLASDVSSFKQWLSTHNTEVHYVLAEPYTLDLGVVNMPLSYYPITNVYNTCVGIPNMYVKYYRDFKKTITTMQVDIENLKEAVSTLTSNQTSMNNDISTLQNVVTSSLEKETESEVTNDDNLQGQ